jgi:hypothetical protein
MAAKAVAIAFIVSIVFCTSTLFIFPGFSPPFQIFNLCGAWKFMQKIEEEKALA